jgi:glycosyltransferase involved in cell wall biosynthesis
VSVVLPVWNAETTVARAIASIQAQTLRDWELVIADDGSTDATPEILARVAADDVRVRIITCRHGGVVAAQEAALAQARGELIARMDADDISHPERLAEQTRFLSEPENASVGVVGSLVEFGGDRAANAGYALHVDWTNSLVTPEAIALNRFIESPLVNPSAMFRRELVERHGGCRDGDFPEDYELYLRWLDAGVRMAKVPRVLLTWQDAPTRLTRTDRRYSPEAFFRIKAEWIAKEVRRLGAERVSVLPSGIPGGTPTRLTPVFVWGAGRPTRKRAAVLEMHGVKIAGYIDVDAKKITPALGGSGVPVIAPAQLPPPGEIFVLGYVSSRGAREVIRDELRARGYGEGRDFLMCA